ncbi:hypothetical protein LCGC14_1801810, partial [marine sediment metagenome]
DGIIFRNSNAPEAPLADDKFHGARYAERVWEFLDSRR